MALPDLELLRSNPISPERRNDLVQLTCGDLVTKAFLELNVESDMNGNSPFVRALWRVHSDNLIDFWRVRSEILQRARAQSKVSEGEWVHTDKEALAYEYRSDDDGIRLEISARSHAEQSKLVVGLNEHGMVDQMSAAPTIGVKLDSSSPNAQGAETWYKITFEINRFRSNRSFGIRFFEWGRQFPDPEATDWYFTKNGKIDFSHLSNSYRIIDGILSVEGK